MLREPLSPSDAKALARKILADGVTRFSERGLKEMKNDAITEIDAVNVIRAGVARPAELENGSWRCRFETMKIVVVVAFRSEDDAELRDELNSAHGELKTKNRRRDGVAEQGEKTMKCLACGDKMKSAVENYKYQSLPGVTLIGIRVDRCGACGESEVEIPRIEDLDKAIACAVIAKHGRLAGAEIRFLRKSLGWSGADLARHMGAEKDTVSRWENDKQPIGPHTDRLLRLMVAVGQPVDKYPLDALEQISDKTEKLRLALRVGAKGWTAAA